MKNTISKTYNFTKGGVMKQANISDEKDLLILSDAVKKYISTDDDEVLQAELTKIKNQTLIQRFFPNSLQKEANKNSVIRIKHSYETKLEFLKIHTEIQLEATREKAESFIKAVKMEYQSRLIEFANKKMGDITTNITNARKSQTVKLKDAYLDLENYKDIEILHDNYKASIDHMILKYFKFTQDLLDGFTDAINYKIKEITKN